ncbi:conserved hypothetical protein [Roseibium sp. TrichSKD4]|uniref:hypothetical protein n=1 Tax=Roseibium sp. TrichSKD4 TaxID=744980 RepID=UPI0001E576FD|nr:hypothetical protein [Roseibium sp. TrichSKD4]EFO28846.1 conserved hypothetical protein [Roseibium sp. TrichSKD4]
MPRDGTKNNLHSSGRDISKEMRDSFHLKGLRRLAELGLKGHHKLDALRVINDYEHARQEEKAHFKENYKARVSKAVKRLQAKAGQKAREFNHPFAFLDRFEKGQMILTARKQVRQAHEVTLSLLDRQETRELESIALKAGRGDIDPELLSKDFDRASDRRSKSERRNQMQSRLRSRSRSR